MNEQAKQSMKQAIATPNEGFTWWVQNNGGLCPLPPRTCVDVVHRDGGVYYNEFVGEYRARTWYLSETRGDIIAYRWKWGDYPYTPHSHGYVWTDLGGYSGFTDGLLYPVKDGPSGIRCGCEFNNDYGDDTYTGTGCSSSHLDEQGMFHHSPEVKVTRGTVGGEFQGSKAMFDACNTVLYINRLGDSESINVSQDKTTLSNQELMEATQMAYEQAMESQKAEALLHLDFLRGIIEERAAGET